MKRDEIDKEMLEKKNSGMSLPQIAREYRTTTTRVMVGILRAKKKAAEVAAKLT